MEGVEDRSPAHRTSGIAPDAGHKEARGVPTRQQMNLATHPLHALRCDSTASALSDVVGAAGGTPKHCCLGVCRGRLYQLLRSCRLTRATISIQRPEAPV